ncbi:MAG: ABC transporter substrate-binding protein [Hyphomicrobiales bacterium]|nr:ABC transporter substrate-binding protein [Hyphomicrobiales bacterium]
MTFPCPDRRTILKLAVSAASVAGAAMLPALARISAARAEQAVRHGLSVFGELKYPANFARFDYVDPGAKKGGKLAYTASDWAFNQNALTFNTLNGYVLKGDAPPRLELLFDSLMVRALDEPDAVYGQLAESVAISDDGNTYRFALRPEARFHDGSAVTAADVAFSLLLLKEKGHPNISQTVRAMENAFADDERTLVVTFAPEKSRDLPLIVAELPVFSKAYWQERDFEASTLEPPLGSGPYRIKAVNPGRSISYERVPDYWGRDLPVSVGRHNFDEIRYEYFRDSTVELEAFKADQFDWRVESTAKVWATAYDFPAVKDGRVIQELFPERGRGLMVGFIPNLRREKFQDPRVRRALSYAFDFEEMNRTIFYNQYERINSYFYGTDLASSGLPESRELEILETVRGEVPEEVFTTSFANPVVPDQGALRDNLREAVRLFNEAGYEFRGGKMVDAKTGVPFTIEYLLNGPSFEKVALRYRESLSRIGIELSVRMVDSSQYVNRVRSGDFDMIYTGWAQSLSPGNEQWDFFGSKAADRPGARNWGGIKNEAVDKLIERLVFATDRDDLIAATHALDRVLLWNHYVVPGWTLPKARIARWDRFGRPEMLPYYSEPGFPDVWWYDSERAAKTGAPR